MKTDTYTKIVLSVIAIALVVLAFENGNLIPSANASSNSKDFALIPVNADGSIDVKVRALPQQTVDVIIKDIDPYAFRYVTPLDVKIRRIDGSAFSDAEPIEVKIRQ